MKDWMLKDLEALVEQMTADERRFEEIFEAERAEDGALVAYAKWCGRQSAAQFNAKSRVKAIASIARTAKEMERLDDEE